MTSIPQHIDWFNGRVPDTVRSRLRQLVAVVGYLPHQQPLAVIKFAPTVALADVVEAGGPGAHGEATATGERTVAVAGARRPRGRYAPPVSSGRSCPFRAPAGA
jgi:hypothetical protein